MDLVPIEYYKDNDYSIKRIEKIFRRNNFRKEAKAFIKKMSDINLKRLEGDMYILMTSADLKPKKEDKVLVNYNLNVSEERIESVLSTLFYSKCVADLRIAQILIRYVHVNKQRIEKIYQINKYCARIEKHIKSIYIGKNMKKKYKEQKDDIQYQTKILKRYIDALNLEELK